jgi:hypothetical protein
MENIPAMQRNLLAAIVVALSAMPGLASACACGCGVFSVGTSAMFPQGAGATVSLEYDYMNQDQNWSGASSAPAAENPDRDIRTDFFTVGAQYMFDRDWGVTAQVPYWDRLFVTTDSDRPGAFHHDALGDVRLLGIYSGFSADLSSGVLFGLKLPTGDYTYRNFDRDTSIGTGSTDVILGAFHQGGLDTQGIWAWFVQGQWQRAVRSRGGYRPGNELDAATGIYYGGWDLGRRAQLAPIVQLIASDRLQDSGPEASAGDSGYRRILIAPGIEYDVGALKLYGDVEIPVYQYVHGDQLVARRQYKFIVAYRF